MAAKQPLNKVKDGLVQRTTGRWSYVVRVPDERTGKTRQKWVSRDDNGKPFPTRAAAKAARDKARHEVNRGTYVAPHDQLLREYLQTWLDGLHRARGNRKARRPSTVANYRNVLTLYVLRHPIADAKLQQLSRPMIEAHWDAVAAAGGKDGRALSDRTVRYAHGLLASALREAVEDGVLARDPSARVGLPQSTVEKRTKEAWSPEQLSRFLTATRDDRLHPLWTLMAHTGMRRGEALALLWKDVNLDKGTVKVHRALSDVDGELVVNDSPKNRKARTVPLNTAAREALQQQRKAQAAEQLAAGPAWVGEGYVFAMEDGRPMRPQYATKSFGRAVAAAELPTISLHGLRHTCGTLLLRAGHPVHLVADLLGHDPAVLLSIYAHAVEDDTQQLVDALDSMLVATG